MPRFTLTLLTGIMLAGCHQKTSLSGSEHVEAKDFFEFRTLDLVAVKGRTQGIRIYELLGRKNEISDSLRSSSSCAVISIA